MGAVRFPIAQLPVPNLFPTQSQLTRNASVTPDNAADATAPSGNAAASRDWRALSVSALRLSVSQMLAQSSNDGASLTLQASHIEAQGYEATLRSDDGLIQYSLSTLTMRASQLSLSFDQEHREQRASQFMQGMNALTGQLQSTDASRLTVSAQALSLRFTSSAAISDRALGGFEKGAALFSGFDTKMLAHFLVLLRTFLDDSDEGASRFLEALNDFLESIGARTNAQNADAAATEDAVASSAAQMQADESADSVRAFFEQIELRYTRVEVSVEDAQPKQADPLVLDLNGDGVEVGNAQPFDIFGSGTAVLTPFPTGGDAYLALDRNGNGVIDSGQELFGDQHGSQHGFAELAKFDANLDGIIDAADPVYTQLLLFGDLNDDGSARPDEVAGLRSAGISAIDLRYEQTLQFLTGGNRISESARFVRNDGSTGQAADIVLQTFSALA